ncbi:MAG: hypothetical protein HYY05_01315 [Chloroflexi bacterium]|nr:hypothetical protein [Chloroflexota bacterium]
MQEIMPRFRLGTISPTSRAGGAIQPYQFYRLLPRDVMLIASPLGLKEYTKELVREALGNYWTCVDELVRHKVDRIVQAGVPIAAQAGRSTILDLLRRTEERTSVPADSDLEAIIAGMKHLGVESVTVGSRWADEVNEALKAYLEAAGVRVLVQTSRGQWGAQAFAMPLEEGVRLAVELGREAYRLAPEADGIVLPGGAWLSIHAIPVLEAELGKPVFTNMNSMVWNAVVRTGVVEPIQGWGRLLARA